MRKLLFLSLAVFSLLWSITPALVHADPGGISSNTGSTTGSTNGGATSGSWCTLDKSQKGVLISGVVVNGGFPCYISSLLTENMPYVILIAVLLVVVSGIQYMTAVGAPAGQAAAKTRILGVLGGIIFYFLIEFILPLVASGIKLK